MPEGAGLGRRQERQSFWRRLRGALVWGGALAGALAGVGAVWLYWIQLRPPGFLATAALVEDEGDREVVAQLAERPLRFFWRDGQVRTEAEGGEVLVGFFKVVEASKLRLLRHENPVIRLYTAFYVAMLRPWAAASLRPLLVDRTPVILSEPAGESDVARVVIAMLCARQDDPRIGSFLSRARRDWRLLAARPVLASCERGSMDVAR